MVYYIGGIPKIVYAWGNTFKCIYLKPVILLLDIWFTVLVECLLRDILPFQFKGMLYYFQTSSIALSKTVFVITVIDPLKSVFIKTEDLVFSINIRRLCDNIPRQVCVSHYSSCWVIRIWTHVSFSSAQVFLFYFLDVSVIPFMWQMDFPGCSSPLLIFLSCFQCLYSFVLSLKIFHQNPTSVCCF